MPYLSIEGALLIHQRFPSESIESALLVHQRCPNLSIESALPNPSKVPYSEPRHLSRLDEIQNSRMRQIGNALPIKLSQIRFLYDPDDPLQLFTVPVADGDLSFVIVTFDRYWEFEFFREA